MKMNYQKEALVIPGAVLNCASGADAAALRVLLWLASDLSLAEKPRQLAKLSDCTAKEAGAAIEYWKKCGILCEDGAEAVPAMAESDTPPTAANGKGKRTLLRRVDELPVYTATELAELMEKRFEVRRLVDEAQQIMGKMFNPNEVNILVGMVDYLGMREDCIMLLLAHCRSIGKTNLRAVEKMAYSLVDDGITDAETLEDKIRQMEAFHSFEGEIRNMFGLKSRSLTGKESRMLQAWQGFGYSAEIVRKAYEITVDAIHEPSLSYTNSILERWNAEGLHTAEEIDAQIAAKKAEKNAKSELGNSFDTDDFFQAALNRSFEKTSKE